MIKRGTASRYRMKRKKNYEKPHSLNKTNMLIYFTNSFVIIFLSLKYALLNTKIYRSHHQRKESIIIDRKYSIRGSGLWIALVYFASMHSAGCWVGLEGAKPGGSGIELYGTCQGTFCDELEDDAGHWCTRGTCNKLIHAIKHFKARHISI